MINFDYFRDGWRGAAQAVLLWGHSIISCILNLMRLSTWWILSGIWGQDIFFKCGPCAPAGQWLSSAPPPTLPTFLPPQHVHTLIWIMFLLQVPPVINGVPFRTMAKSGLYWLTLIIDSRRPLPWFMIVCYFYISCQIHLVYPGPGSAPQTVNIQHCICNPPPHNNRFWLCFCQK